MPELVLIFIVALLVFGPKKLPEIGKSLGKGLAEFKRASDELKKTIETEIEQGKNEVSAVRASLRSALPLGESPAAAPAPVGEPGALAAVAAETSEPPETIPQPDSRPIEPS
jgi:sec-independent protein translocase protein TatA